MSALTADRGVVIVGFLFRRWIDRIVLPAIRCHDYLFNDDAEVACSRIFQAYLAAAAIPMW